MIPAVIAILLTVMLLAYLAFAYRYMRYSPWRATWQGVTLLSQKLTLAALALFFIVDTLIEGFWPARFLSLTILLSLLAIEACATLAGLLHVQRAHRPVSKRQGTGYVLPEEIERTKPPRKGSQK